MKKLSVPKFDTEAEEARWWDEHMNDVEENLIEAIESGTAKRGGPQRILEERRVQDAAQALRVSLPAADRAKLHELAECAGQDDATFAASLIHRALWINAQLEQTEARLKG
jgi:hypothetical protein